MKTIKFTQTYADERELFIAGREYVLPDDEAAVCIRGGVAVEQASPSPSRRKTPRDQEADE